MSYVNLTSIQADASSQITVDRARVYNLYVSTSTNAGFIRLRDGGSAGDVRFEITLPDTGDTLLPPFHIELPRYGINFKTSLYMEVSNATSVTLVFDGTLVPILELASGGFLHLTDGAPLELAA